MEGGEGAYAASTPLPSAEKGTRKHRHSQHLVWPASTYGQGISCLALAWQTHRDSRAFVPYFGKWAPGASPASESPSVSSPQPMSLGQWVARACLWLAYQEWGAGSSTDTSPTCTGGGAGWMGLFWAGTMLKGRSVTRWSRGRHQSNKCCLHKVTT